MAVEPNKLLVASSLFSSLTPDDVARLAERCLLAQFDLGDVVIRQGEGGDTFYIVYSGKARVVDETGGDRSLTVASLSVGDSFGEEALLYRMPQPHTVRASSRLTVLKLRKADFEWLVSTFPKVRSVLEEEVRELREVSFLKNLNILSSLSPGEINTLLNAMDRVELHDGDVLFHEGEAGDAAYIVRAGRIRIVKESADGALIATLPPGALLGEMALMYRQPRTAAAVAEGETVMLRLDGEVFNSLISKSPKVREMIAKQATNRLLQQDTILASAAAAALDAARASPLQWRSVRFGDRMQSRSLTLVQTEVPVLAGIACLAMVGAWYKRDAAPPGIEEQLRTGQPDTLLTVSRKAESLGYTTRLMHLDMAALGGVRLPALAELRGGRLVVVFAVRDKQILCADPMTGFGWIERPEFAAAWTGDMLSLEYVGEVGAAGAEPLMRRFWSLVRPFGRTLAVIVALSLLLQLLGLISPLFSQIIVDKVLVHGDRSLLKLMFISVVFVALFQLAGSLLREVLVVHVVRRINTAMLVRFFKHVLGLPQKVVAKWQVGDLLLRFYENDKLVQLVSQSGFRIAIDSLTVLIYLVALFALNGRLTAVAIVFVVAYGLLMLISAPILRATDRRAFDRRKVSESLIIESIGGIETIKSMAREGLFYQNGVDALVEAKRAQFSGALVAFNVTLVGSLIEQASVIAVLGYGALLALGGTMTTGELVAFNATLGLLLAPLAGLVGVWDKLQEARISFERLNDVLTVPTEPRDEAAQLPAIEGHVRFENVSFRYDGGERDVLSGITFAAQPGQKVAFVGRSGSGKTTLVSLLTRLFEPTTGKILIDNREIAGVDLASLRRQIGVVEQLPFLFNGTVRENIARVDPTIHYEKMVAAAMLAGAHDFVERLPLGYDTQIGERGTTLSGGQKQRIVIARAILTSPRILILDEATAALDTESERVIQENLDKLMAGRTTFIIAHRLSTVRNADTIVVVDEGRIVEQGTHEELMRQKGLYASLNSGL